MNPYPLKFHPAYNGNPQLVGHLKRGNITVVTIYKKHFFASGLVDAELLQAISDARERYANGAYQEIKTSNK